MNNSSQQTLPTTNSSGSRGLSPIQDSPVELPAQLSTVGVPQNDRTSDYYEDVDPRFAEPIHNPPRALPSLLVPGGASSNPNLLNPNNISNTSLNSSDPNLRRNSSLDEMDAGSRSPAASEAS